MGVWDGDWCLGSGAISATTCLGEMENRDDDKVLSSISQTV